MMSRLSGSVQEVSYLDKHRATKEASRESERVHHLVFVHEAAPVTNPESRSAGAKEISVTVGKDKLLYSKGRRE